MFDDIINQIIYIYEWISKKIFFSILFLVLILSFWLFNFIKNYESNKEDILSNTNSWIIINSWKIDVQKNDKLNTKTTNNSTELSKKIIWDNISIIINDKNNQEDKIINIDENKNDIINNEKFDNETNIVINNITKKEDDLLLKEDLLKQVEIDLIKEIEPVIILEKTPIIEDLTPVIPTTIIEWDDTMITIDPDWTIIITDWDTTTTTDPDWTTTTTDWDTTTTTDPDWTTTTTDWDTTTTTDSDWTTTTTDWDTTTTTDPDWTTTIIIDDWVETITTDEEQPDIIDDYFDNVVIIDIWWWVEKQVKIATQSNKAPVYPTPAECPTWYSQIGIYSNVFSISTVQLPYYELERNVSMELTNEYIFWDNEINFYYKVFNVNWVKIWGVTYKTNNPDYDYFRVFTICLKD